MTTSTSKKVKKVARILLGSFLVAAGIGHLSYARKAFQAQVPNWVPLKKDDTIVYSGYVEILLGAALIASPEKYKEALGKTAAVFFIAVFPGNIAQYIYHRDSLGLDTDTKRLVRLFFQPALIYAALKSTSKESKEENDVYEEQGSYNY